MTEKKISKERKTKSTFMKNTEFYKSETQIKDDKLQFLTDKYLLKKRHYGNPQETLYHFSYYSLREIIKLNVWDFENQIHKDVNQFQYINESGKTITIPNINDWQNRRIFVKNGFVYSEWLSAGDIFPETIARCVNKMKRPYKDFPKLDIGGSDSAYLTVNSTEDINGNISNADHELKFGEDGDYKAYITYGDVEIGSHYKKKLEFNNAKITISDDDGPSFFALAEKITIYRAGEFGCIIDLQGDNIQFGSFSYSYQYKVVDGEAKAIRYQPDVIASTRRRINQV